MFDEPFELLKFPKISGNSVTGVPVVCVQEYLFVGVSGSSVNKLTILPPQVLSAQSVAPGTIITAILSEGPVLKAYATSERGKFHLHILNAGDGSYSTVSASKEVEEEISALYLSSDKLKIAAVCKSSSVVDTYDIENLEKISSSTTIERGASLYTSQLHDDEVQQTIFVQISLLKSGISLRTYVLDPHGARCLKTVPLELQKGYLENTDLTKWASYDSYLYAVNSGVVSVFTVPDGLLKTSFHLESSEPVAGLVALPHNNLAVSRKNVIELVDCTYESKISSTTLPGKPDVELLAYSDYTSTLIALNNKDLLIGVSVKPTGGTLLESIGKGSGIEADNYSPIADIFGGFTDQTERYAELLENAKAEADSLLEDLRSYIENKDGVSFSKIVTYLKSPHLSWLQNRDEIEVPSQQNLVFEETDRVADAGVISAVCKLAFLPMFKPYMPVGVALYLLTHPLFPVTDPAFRKMMKTLERSDSILYRQALVSLTGLTVEDLVVGLLSKDEGTFLDAATRLQEEFGPQQILSGIRRAFAGMQSVSALSILIERLSRYESTIGLIGPFVDAIGLLSWEPEHIRNLREKINKSIATIENLSITDSVITELFDSVGVDPSASSVPSAAELQARSQKKKAAQSQDSVLAKYSVETLVL